MINKQIDRITIQSGKRGGNPCISGTRVTIYDIFSYLASGMTIEEILIDFPYLNIEDIKSCFDYVLNSENKILTSI